MFFDFHVTFYNLCNIYSSQLKQKTAKGFPLSEDYHEVNVEVSVIPRFPLIHNHRNIDCFIAHFFNKLYIQCGVDNVKQKNMT